MDLYDRSVWLRLQVNSSKTPGSEPSTRDKVLILREKDPNITAVEMSKIIGVTRERIRQILSKAGLEIDVRPRLMDEKTKDHKCKYCGTRLWDLKRQFCSQECFFADSRGNWLEFPCCNCGKTVSIRESMQRVRVSRGSKRVFCSRDCFATWRANNPGILRRLDK